jgi:hypothetical protein
MDAALVWKVRRKHILIWGVIIAAVIAAVCYLLRHYALAEEGIWEMVFYGIAVEALLIWILAPISVTKAKNGSRVSKIARAKLSTHGWQYNYNDISEYERDQFESTHTTEEVQFWGAVGLFFMLLPFAFFFILNRIKNIGCYLIVAIGFPVSTFIYYMRSRKKLNIYQVAIPLLIVFVLYPACFVVLENIKTEEEEVQQEARHQAYEEALAEAQSIDYDLSFGKDMDELQEDEIRLVTVEESNRIYYSSKGYGLLAEVPEGEILIGTGKTSDTSKSSFLYYQVYLTADRTRTGWILGRKVEEM